MRGCFNIAVCFNLGSHIPWDEDYVDMPKEYIPERFLPDAVQARKGTHREALDHRLLSTPFSAGARMCLGARVAHLELLALTSRLIQDWEISLEPGQSFYTRQFLMMKADPFPKFIVRPTS